MTKAQYEAKYNRQFTDKQVELLNKHDEMVANNHPSMDNHGLNIVPDSSTIAIFTGRKSPSLRRLLHEPQGVKQWIAYNLAWVATKIYTFWWRRK